MLEHYTVESKQTVGTSQPKIPVRGLCQCINYTWRTVFRSPRRVRELCNSPIAGKPGSTQTRNCKEEADHERPHKVSKTVGCPTSPKAFLRETNHASQRYYEFYSPRPGFVSDG